MAFVAIGYAAVAGGYWVVSRRGADSQARTAGPQGPGGGTSSPADAAQPSSS
jgi:hypothetical protein